MRLRLPGKVEGWRRFAGEIAIVVVGVLIALGAQQLVEDRSDRARADSALAALRAEAGETDFAASEIEITRPCVIAQLDAVEKRLVAGDRLLIPLYSDKVINSPFVVRTPSRVWPDSTWQSVNSTDVLRRLEPRRESYIASFYAQLVSQRLASQSVRAVNYELNALGHIMPSSEAERMRLITTVERLRGTFAAMDIAAGQLRDALAAAGLLQAQRELDKDLADSGTIAFCRAHGLPLGKLRPAIAVNAD